MTTTVIERHRKVKPPGKVRRLLRTWWGAAAAVVVLLVLFSAWVAGQVQRDNNTEQLQQQTAATQEDLQKVSDPLAQLCSTNETARRVAGDDACQTAARVVQVPGPQGLQGLPGDPGRGIVSTTINDAGNLLVTYSDGAQIDVGRVAGTDGTDGTPGRGISAANIADGRLVLAFSDGGTQDLGPIVGERGADGSDGANGKDGEKGEAGRGIASTEIADGRLVITYTDGTTEDAGPVPAGEQGPMGPAAELPASYTENFADGSSRTCTRAAGDTDDSSPTYDCHGREPGGNDEPDPEPPADETPDPEAPGPETPAGP